MYFRKMNEDKTKFKTCSNCKQTKPITEFYKKQRGLEERISWCKECCARHQITPKRVWSRKKCHLTHGNYRGETDRKKLTLMSLEEFLEWDTWPNRKCYYCELPEKFLWVIDKITRERWLNVAKKIRNSKRLHLDRKDNKKGYTKDNTVWACPICSMIKRKFFTAKEWKEIAQKYIKPLWQKEL